MLSFLGAPSCPLWLEKAINHKGHKGTQRIPQIILTELVLLTITPTQD